MNYFLCLTFLINIILVPNIFAQTSLASQLESFIAEQPRLSQKFLSLLTRPRKGGSTLLQTRIESKRFQSFASDLQNREPAITGDENPQTEIVIWSKTSSQWLTTNPIIGLYPTHLEISIRNIQLHDDCDGHLKYGSTLNRIDFTAFDYLLALINLARELIQTHERPVSIRFKILHKNEKLNRTLEELGARCFSGCKDLVKNDDGSTNWQATFLKLKNPDMENLVLEIAFQSSSRSGTR